MKNVSPLRAVRRQSDEKMASRRTLKTMVQQFRVAELQTLLEAFGERNLKLRKKELQKKALHLVNKKKSRSVTQKVMSLHRRLNCPRRPPQPAYDLRAVRARYVDSYREESPLYDDDVVDNNGGGDDDAADGGGGHYYAPDPFGVDRYSDYKRTPQFDLADNSAYLSTFEHLDVDRIRQIKFPALPFYHYVSDILLVTPLVPKSESDALFEFRTSFGLKSDAFFCLFGVDADANDEDAKYEALLRLGLVNEKFELEEALPQKLFVSINDRFCPCVPENAAGKHDSSGKRSPGVPMNVTPYIRGGLMMHKLTIHWSVSYHLVFAATIQLVRRRRVDDLIRCLVRKGEQDPAVSKKFIYDNLNDEDNEIAATSLKMSLTCPLGKMLMTLPTRATTCNHLQCFDGALYIKMNEVKSTWQCPVCSQSCQYDDLFVDGYFMDILRSENFRSDIRDVQLSADGSWQPAVLQETKKRPNKRRSSSPIDVVAADAAAENKRSRPSDAQSPDEILPHPARVRSPQPQPPPPTSIVDDLKEIFSSFISDRSQQYPQFSVYDSIFPGEGFDDGGGGGSAQNLTRTNRAPQLPGVSAPAEKKVLLVDLTLSDTESDGKGAAANDDENDDDDDIKSTSSFSSSSSSSSSGESVVPESPTFYIDRVRNDPFHPSGAAFDLCSNAAALRHFLNPTTSSPPVYDIDDSDG